ncbi:MAG: hypothetical protein JW751_15665 [Polyangiaceae bacterium]|nr:hypothetical protein [Polyangiaceae bacterium]
MSLTLRFENAGRARGGTVPALVLLVASTVIGSASCRTGGHAWVDPRPRARSDWGSPSAVAPPPEPIAAPAPYAAIDGRVIAEAREEESSDARARTVATKKIEGRVLGVFRNTYYDFPAERDFEGLLVPLRSAKCDKLADVPRGFFEAVCVQGSGTLGDGSTVSFAKRDCECAEVCPRTGQRICFDRLDPSQYPWGRGATGGPITPLLTVAVDSTVIPLGTPIYIPEYDGLPRDTGSSSIHDGCFIAQDRGLKVQGQQVDIFTGLSAMTKLWNRLVPSNTGVRVVLDNPKCARAPAP